MTMLVYDPVIVTQLEGYTILEGRNGDIRDWLNAHGENGRQYCIWRGLNGKQSFTGLKADILARITK